MKINGTKIKVSKKDIGRGLAGSPCECPIALAIKRTFGKGVSDVYVDSDLQLKINNKDFVMYLPKKCINFIRKFDDEENVKPISFVLRGEILE